MSRHMGLLHRVTGQLVNTSFPSIMWIPGTDQAQVISLSKYLYTLSHAPAHKVTPNSLRWTLGF